MNDDIAISKIILALFFFLTIQLNETAIRAGLLNEQEILKPMFLMINFNIKCIIIRLQRVGNEMK